MMRIPSLVVVLLAGMGSLFAQQSASYEIESAALNAGGRPSAGAHASSVSFELRSEALGEAALAAELTSSSYRVAAGLLPAYRPVGEVPQLSLSGSGLLKWPAAPHAFRYAVYRDALGSLPGGHGTCAVDGLAVREWEDTMTPSPGSGVFYLVTAANRLGEEGTKGSESDGTPRSASGACP